jgi:hypothetical protein
MWKLTWPALTAGISILAGAAFLAGVASGYGSPAKVASGYGPPAQAALTAETFHGCLSNDRITGVTLDSAVTCQHGSVPVEWRGPAGSTLPSPTVTATRSATVATFYGCLYNGWVTNVALDSAQTCEHGSSPIHWRGPGGTLPSPSPTATTSAPSTTPASVPTSPSLAPTSPSLAPTSPAPSTSSPAPSTSTEDCPAGSPTSAPGCGEYNFGPDTSGYLPGFAADITPASDLDGSYANLLTIDQNGWSGGQGEQDLTASSFDNWSVTATDTDPSDAPGEVLTGPEASYDYDNLDAPPNYLPPAEYDLNNITSLTSNYSETMPASNLNYLAESDYDIWLNNWDTEVMIWVDNHQGANVFANSGDTEVGTYTLGGQSYTLWDNGTGINGFYIFSLNGGNQPTGTVDIHAILEQLVTLGEIPAASPLTEIAFGWEISSTYGVPMTFTMNNFTIDFNGLGN